MIGRIITANRPDKTANRIRFLISVFLVFLISAALPFWSGCASTSSSKKESIFDPSGSCLFNPNYKCPLSGSKKTEEAKQIPASKEPTPRDDGAASACSTSPWTSSETSTPIFRGKESDRWTAQLPNGGVLFPKYFNARGPKVVMEPKTIVAQVGTEVVMVSSYVGEDNEYLKTGQKLEWNIDGTGHFITSNPSNSLCSSSSTKRKSPVEMTTATSSKTWRIHRGTSAPEDDITILRGQSWATVQAGEEGTTAVSVYAPNIDNWNNRTATGQIHWIDATFRYPTSTVTPVGQTLDLTTSVFRKTVPEPRAGWIVRYEILSGPTATLGAGGETVVEVATNDLGQATVPLTQTSGAPGSSKVKVQIIRPAGDGMERVVIDEQTVTELWSGNAIFTLGFKGPNTGTPGSRLSYEMEVTNLSPLAQDAVVRVALPPGTRITSSNPAVSGYEGSTAVWELDGLPGSSRQLIAFDLDCDTDGLLSFNARVDQRGATYTTPSSSAPDTDPAPPLDAPSQFAEPPVTIPNEPPASQAPSGTDAASVAPSLDSDTGGAAAAPAPSAETVPPGSVELKADMFPGSISQNREFNGRIRISKTGDLPALSLSVYFPSGVYLITKDPNGGETKRYTGSPTPVVFNDFQYDEDYVLYFTADRPGDTWIRFVVNDTSSKKELAEKQITLSVIP